MNVSIPSQVAAFFDALSIRCGLFMLLFAAIVPAAFACPDDQYESCILNACICLPKVGGEVGRVGEQIKRETNAETQGPILAAWIQGSRDTAVGTSKPIPRHIRNQLTGYIREDVLNKAKYKVGDNGILNLAGLSIAYGDRIFGSDVTAVALIDVIVFRNNADANDPALWAHELTHVQQFTDWGVLDFGKRYARNAGSVEEYAYAVQNNFWSWNANRRTPQSVPSVPVPAAANGFPSGTGMLACGCWGPNPNPYADEQRCMSRRVRVATCAGWCAPGHPLYGYVCM